MHPLDEQLEAGLRGDFQRGWEIAEFLAKETPDDHRAAFNRAWYEMMRGQLLKGLECLDRGRWLQVFGDGLFPTDKPIYREEDLKDRHLLLRCEGGLGDEIINVRFAQDFHDRGAKVTVACDPSLRSIFARVAGVSAVVAHRGAVDVHHDYWVPAMSAARVLHYEYPNLTGAPYLSVHPEYRRKWSDFFQAHSSDQRRPRIGLRFYGNPKFEHEQHRRFPPQRLIDALGDRPWVSLQKEDTTLPLAGWEDTLAVIDQLDLVITSCTSVAHASAALGKETWVITPILPYYVWALPGERSPWYSAVRLFRQKVAGDWTAVFQEITQALDARKQV